MAELRKLIFYSTIGPDRDNAAWTPFTMAKRALDAQLDVEIFLAGPATGLLRHEVRSRQEGRQREALDAVIEARVRSRSRLVERTTEGCPVRTSTR